MDFLGVLPAALLVALAAWQLALAGQATWLAADAARVAVRADAVGRDPRAAARSALPSYLRERLVVKNRPDGGIAVRVGVPLVLKRWGTPLRIGASASMEEGR